MVRTYFLILPFLTKALFFIILKRCNPESNDITISKRARNYVSFLHNLGSIFLSFSNEYRLVEWSSNYFIWDFLQVIMFNESYLMLHHHIVSILVLNNIKYHRYFLLLFRIGEISNLWTYVVYDNIKRGYNSEIIRNIQALWVFCFRGCVFTHYLIQYSSICRSESPYLYFNLVILYLLGIYWTHNILSSRIKSLKRINIVFL